MPKQELILKLLRFGLVGGAVTLVFMGLSQLFSDWWGKQIGFFAAYPIALTLHFCLNKWWTFSNAERNAKRQIRDYLIMAAVTFFLQWSVYTILTTWTHIAAGLAAAAANVSQVAVSYILMDRRVFAVSEAP